MLCYLSILLLLFQLLKQGLKLLLLLHGLFYGSLTLLLVGHGHYGQNQVYQVEGTKKNHQDKENHVGLPRGPQCLERKNQIPITKFTLKLLMSQLSPGLCNNMSPFSVTPLILIYCFVTSLLS